MFDLANIWGVVVLFIGFVVIVVSSNQLSRLILKLKLPLITGFLLFGILAGPYGLNLISKEATNNLNFINEISLAFIAFAAGAELYIKELRKSFKSILWNTFGQFIITFSLGAFLVYFLADFIPFIKDLPNYGKIAITLLIATVFVARSPSSAIAIIDEMRAKGPFTQISIGVTVLTDVLVIILFALCLSVSANLIDGTAINYTFFVKLIAELLLAFSIGLFIGWLIQQIIRISFNPTLKSIIVLSLGYGAYIVSGFLSKISHNQFNIEIHVEPLLICITASFYVINYCKNRFEFQKILQDYGPYIYVAFFTLTGAMISPEVLYKSWFVTLILFGIRLVALIIGAYTGSTLAKDPPHFKRIGWMPFVTQAGISLALITAVSEEFPFLGNEFATIMISVIVLNQLLGPPLFKWAIAKVGESNLRAKIETPKKIHTAILFGLDYQSLALANELKKHLWNVKIISRRKSANEFDIGNFEIHLIDSFNHDTLKSLNILDAHAAVCMLSDEENYNISQLIYKNFNIKEIIVRLQNHSFFNKFKKLGVTIVEPTTAVVGLIDHFVRAPLGTSILFGLDSNYDTIDIDVQDKKLHGTSLRDLRLPADVLILAVNRKGQSLVSHGYTRLRLGDVVTLFGSPESLEKVHLRFEIS